MFVPAHRLELVAKVDRWQPDLAVLDLEDAVPEHAKERTRTGLADALADGLLDGVEAAFVVRVNAPGSPWHEDDLTAVAAHVPGTVNGVVVPKAETPAPLQHVRDVLPSAFVVGGIETALGAADSRPLLASGLLDAVYFGAEDYVSDLGGRRTPGGDEVHVMRSLVALHARLAGVPALDQAFLRLDDYDGLASETAAGLALGYVGKICVHPDQVAVVHSVQRPSADEEAHARRVLDAAAGGVGALDGVMVDAVHVRMAEQVLARLG